jgi:hypothetical protein
VGRVRLDLSPQLIDEYAEILHFATIIRTPDRLKQPGMWDWHVGVG